MGSLEFVFWIVAKIVCSSSCIFDAIVDSHAQIALHVCMYVWALNHMEPTT